MTAEVKSRRKMTMVLTRIQAVAKVGVDEGGLAGGGMGSPATPLFTGRPLMPRRTISLLRRRAMRTR